jgi:hypothetical protein
MRDKFFDFNSLRESVPIPGLEPSRATAAELTVIKGFAALF